MKVLFAVSNEDISKMIVKKYQKEYKEIISYKNVYYFNAILKEIQKDKRYDRIVISEDLEPSTNSNYQQMDKFIYDRLDSISDEASNMQGENIPIIILCSERRTKGEEILSKFFSIGIYDALIGKDREVDEVCALLNRPRSKKEAKEYYRLDGDTNGYESPKGENEVSEVEIQNILAHYKRIGKDEEKYVESFDNIALQYNDLQLKTICQFLPLNVRAVLEEKSMKYQKLMAFDKPISKKLRASKSSESTSGTVEKLLTTPNSKKLFTEDVVIPTTIKKENIKKVTRKPEEVTEQKRRATTQNTEVRPMKTRKVVKQAQEIVPEIEENIENKIEQIEEPVVQPKRGRGRPKKVQEVAKQEEVVQPPKRRGRPPKKKVEEVLEEQNVLPGFEDDYEDGCEDEDVINKYNNSYEETMLPGFEDEEDDYEDENTLPGFEDEEDDYEDENTLPGFEDEEDDYEEDNTLPGFEDEEDDYEDENTLPGFSDEDEDEHMLPGYEEEETDYDDNYNEETSVTSYEDEPEEIEEENYTDYQNSNSTYGGQNTTNNSRSNLSLSSYNEDDYGDVSSLLTGNNKIVTFVGTSKNGTSFVLNNLAELLSSQGIDVAILDTTQNRNSYYIYTKNEENLRKKAYTSIENLANGVADGIQVNNNLTVYTSLPTESGAINNVEQILGTLLKAHSLILIDADFKTPMGYFANSQEIYLVQSMDVLTIQPLTAFLREMKAREILQQQKIRIVINKYVKLKSVTEKAIIGGMSCYNDPAMSFMTELFDRNTVKYITIPFENEIYSKYLDGLINCDISLKGYSKTFMQTLKQLGNSVYPLISSGNKAKYTPPSTKQQNSGVFSNNMNSTLQQMKKKY